MSAAPALASFKIANAIGFVVLVMLANLRGVKESGTFFAIPTYGFILSIAVLLGSGFYQCLSSCPSAESAGLNLPAGSRSTRSFCSLHLLQELPRSQVSKRSPMAYLPSRSLNLAMQQ